MSLSKDFTRLSFFDLFEKHNYAIEIPILQRDYAQGRESKKDVRDTFLDSLKEYLEENKANRDLDFIYGYTSAETGKFIPLDGQQRLTTLFLLHWYLASVSDSIEHFKAVLQQKTKSRFTYRTRFSSAEFCDALLQSNINIHYLPVTNTGKNDSLSKSIKNKSWFLDSWKFDPTIQSMLVMLDSIHNKFYDCPVDYYNSLVDENNPVITFLFLDLENLQQSDDLYIKMNARGKPLTEFENFKARLEQKINEVFKGDTTEYTLSVTGNNLSLSFRDYFTFKIDTIWNNIFWRFKHLVSKDNSYDDELMNFIKVLIANNSVEEHSDESADINFLFKNEPVSFRELEKTGVLSKGVITALKEGFDILCNKEEVPNLIKDSFYFNEADIFQKVLKNSLSYPERIKLHAYLQYLRLYPTKINELQDWIRVVSNLVENTRIESTDDTIKALKAINNLLPHASSFLTYLMRSTAKIDFFFPEQVKEERLKARLFTKSAIWKENIIKAEQELFHKGQIAYLFEFAGIFSRWLEDTRLSYDSETDNKLLNAFNRYRQKSKNLFSILDNNANADYLLERSLLTKGNYLIPATKFRYNFGSAKHTPNYDRDYSWKRLLRLDNSKEDNDELSWNKRRGFIKLLMNDPRLKTGNIRDDLYSVVEDGAEDWRKYFIKDYRFISFCKQGFIYTQNWNDIQLLNASQMNHLRTDLITYDLYLRSCDNWQEKLLPFESEGFFNSLVRATDDEPYFSLGEWCYKRIYYAMDVNYAYDYQQNIGRYYLFLKKPNGNNKQDLFAKEIRSILEEASFKWDDTNNEFYFSSKSRNELEKKLFSVCKSFKEISE